MADNRVDFFVSYNHRDLKWASWVNELLKANGYTTLFQQRDCPPGSNFVGFMDEALKRSERTLGILTPNSLQSDYVQLEWQNTIVADVSGRQGKLLLVRVAECFPEGVFGRIGFLDLVGKLEEDLEQTLLEGVKGSPESLDRGLPIHRPLQHKPFVNGRFAGREAQLNSLLAAIRQSAEKGDSFGLYGLRGMGGVGKSRLAAELADRLAPDTSLFPGGVLWCNLLQESSELIVRKWLQALQVESTHLEFSALFETLRQTIARKKPLVVCDNVQHPDQTRDLLVNTAGVITLITTREERNIPPTAHRERVDTFSPDDASEMIEKLLGPSAPQEVTALSQLCGYVPLFLEIACQAILERRTTIRRYVEALRAKGLERLEKHDQRAALIFESSYETLPTEEQELFGLLSQFPGPSFGGNFVQACLEVDEFDAEDLLTGLESRSLLIRLEDTEDNQKAPALRFRFHDLVRDFAGRKIPNAESLRPQLTSVWTDWDFVEQELAEMGAFALSSQCQQLGLRPDDSPEFVAWNCFLRGQAHVLNEHPNLFYQQALNEARESPVSQTAVTRQHHPKTPTRWLEWINRPNKFFIPACELVLQGHTESVNSVAITPDGQRAVSASYDKTLRVWDLQSGAQIHLLEGHTAYVNHVAITPDGQRAVSASYDGTVRVWNLKSGTQIHLLKEDTNYVYSVAITPDGQRAVSVSNDGTVRVWDLQNGRILLRGGLGPAFNFGITPDGLHAFSMPYDGTLPVWDLQSGRQIHRLRGSGVYINIGIMPDGLYATSNSYGTLSVWDLQSGSQIHRWEGHTDDVTSVAITPDGQRAVSASKDKTLRVWDLQSTGQIHSLKGQKTGVLGLAITPDGQRAVCDSCDTPPTLTVWDLKSGAQTHSLEGHTKHIHYMAITPDSLRVVSASFDSTLRVWDLQSGGQIHRWEGHTDDVTSVAITSDGQRAVSASDDKTLRVWDLKSGDCLAEYPENSSEIEKLWDAVHPNSHRTNLIATGVQLRQTANSRPLAYQPGHFRVAACSGDGRFLITGSNREIGIFHLRHKPTGTH